MFTWKSRLARGATATFVAVSLSGLLSLSASAQDASFGSREFTVSCAVCHGSTGKGDGDMAKFLTVKPADLTVLAKNNGGEYPFLRVFQTIDGRTQVSGHGDRAMPIWGDRYQAETGVQPGTYGSELMVRGQILELVYFIQSIQEK
jgi:mono/diheme cytochrome c family protein